MHESALTAAARQPAGGGTAPSVPAARAPAPRWLLALGSARAAVCLIVWLAAAVAYSFDQDASATWSLIAPCGLTIANLLAAIAVRPVFRASPSLLAFHLCLAAIVLLVGVSRLTYFRGSAELAQGEAFAGALVQSEAGPLHAGGLAALRFVNDGFEIDYAAGRRRADTRNRVRWADARGQVSEAVVGDDRPLVLGGYRFYTTPNKGFAPRLIWRAGDAAPVRGTVHLPPYPVYESAQAAQWRPPGLERDLTLELQLDPGLIPDDAPAQFRLPDHPRLMVRDGALAVPLSPGQTVALAGGTLRFEALVTWMGYRIDYDPAAPWLLAASLLACLALGHHTMQRWRLRPWNPT